MPAASVRARTQDPATPSEQAGCFGKVPPLGDFVTRNLDPVFVECWDSWLRRALPASRASIGEAWLELYLVSPVWYFVLGPKAAGTRPHAGLFAPSVDRVGRCYPLMIAAPLTVGDVAGRWRSWFADASDLLLEVLQDDGDVAGFFAGVGNLGAPVAPAIERRAPAGAALGPADLASIVATSATSYWWTDGSEAVPASTIICPAGLPGNAAFAAFLDGEWTRHGWHDEAVADEAGDSLRT